MNGSDRVRPEVLAALGGALFMIATQVAGRATRDALFLSHFEATDLPKVMIASALVSALSALALSNALARAAPVRVVPGAFAASAVALVGEWFLILAAPGIGAVVLYLHIAAFGAVLISGFWSVVNERFDPHTAKRTIGHIASGAALGGIVGGVAAERLSSLFGLPAMLLAMSGMHGVCALAIWRIGASPSRTAPDAASEGFGSGLRILRQNRYLRQMAGLVLLCAVSDALLDYALKAEAAGRFESGEDLIQFFAVFYTVTGLLTFGIQASAGSRVLKQFGLGGAMLALPALTIVTGLFATAYTRLWTVVAARGTESVLSNSLFRSGFELLYTPVPAATKRPTKIFVDVGAQRAGDLAGSGMVLSLLLLPVVPIWMVIGLAVVASCGVLVAVRALERGYVGQLESSLRSGLALDEGAVVDATTARTIAATQMGLDRQEILAMIRERQAAAEAPEVAEPVRVPATPAVPEPTTLAGCVDDLDSGDPARIRRVLRRGPDDRRLVPHVVVLLDNASVADEAMAFLRAAAPGAVGQLVDWLLDPSQPAAVRRRLARILEVCDDARAVNGLQRALSTGPLPANRFEALEEFEVRRLCAQAAARIVSRDRTHAISPEAAHALVLRELSVSSEIWERQGRRPSGERESSVMLDGRSIRRIPRSVEHVFTLLGLAMDREVMASTLGGLYSQDANVRGTALEYLDISLPEQVRTALTARLEAPAPVHRPKRAATEVADELLRSSAGIILDRDQLQKESRS